MIDWPAAMALAAALTRRGDEAVDAVEKARSAGPAVQNLDFPLSPLPLMVDADEAAAWAEQATAYVRLLDRIIEIYRGDAGVRAWYGLAPHEERLIAADPGHVVVCRLDGYLPQDTQQPVILENNSDSPAGSLFTARVNRLVLQALALLEVDAGQPSALTYLSETALLDAIRERTPGLQSLAILQEDGAVTRESAEMAEAFTSAGVETFVADPRSMTVEGEGIRLGGRPADACWNKINTAPWRRLVAAHPELVDVFERAARSSAFVNVNPFGPRYVTESKLSLALPQQERFADLFTTDERDLVARVLPWGRRVTAGLADRVLEEQHEFVLKEPYDIRGDGVTIGRVTARHRWRAAVADAVRQGHIAQRFVEPTRYPVLQPGRPGVMPMSTSFDTFVLGGAVRGFGAKAGLSAHVNVFRGGRKLAVLVPGGDAGGRC
jgi:hypothetical protein